MINFRMLATQLLDKFERLTPYERYKWCLSQYYLANYKMGKENFKATDCSGVLSGALYMAGFNIRCTVDFFYDHIFMQEWEPENYIRDYGVCFLVNPKVFEVKHVMPHIGYGVFVDAIQPCRFVTRGIIEAEYCKDGFIPEYRSTSEKTLSAFSVSLLAATEIDKEIAELLGV